jgi:hypothetical protein
MKTTGVKWNGSERIIMKTSHFLATAALVAGTALTATAPAIAGANWSVNVGVGGYYPPPVYAAPAPYYAPPVVVTPPPPVYVQPPYPQPVYTQPYVYGGGYYPAPRYIAPPVYYYRGGYRHYHDYRDRRGNWDGRR